MNNTLLIAASTVGLVLILIGFFKIIKMPIEGLKHFITVNELGELEGGIVGLTDVIVVCDVLEQPEHTLYEAVKVNFKRGVKYSFFISKSNFEEEKKGRFKFFQGMLDMQSKPGNSRNLLSIDSLTTEWDDYPIIFFRYLDKRQEHNAFAYMGTQLKEGIADKYELIPPTICARMMKFAFKDINFSFRSRLEEELVSEDLPNVVPFTKRQA